jgi:hypothetical protein
MALELGGTWGIAFLVSAGIAHEIMAKDNSSPQTTEINAATRAETLMKWVHIGQVETLAFILIAAAVDRKNRAPILLGGFSAMIINEIEYTHAKAAGLAKLDQPGTENWSRR